MVANSSALYCTIHFFYQHCALSIMMCTVTKLQKSELRIQRGEIELFIMNISSSHVKARDTH